LLGQFSSLPARAQEAPPTIKALEISEQNADLLNHLQDYPNLEVLSINCIESLQTLPEAIGTLHKLRELLLDNGNGCVMNPVIPESIGNLHALEKLVLIGAQDPRFDEERVDPLLKKRHEFPKSMSQLKNLAYLDLSRNGLEEIPEFVKDLPRLRELGFAWNMNVRALPPFLVNLRQLRTLRLDADGLTDLPDFLNQLPMLCHITLGDNCRITQSAARKSAIRSRFPKIRFDFRNEYDCPNRN
jgi:Leucine-rich repeat (LRR) protein